MLRFATVALVILAAPIAGAAPARVPAVIATIRDFQIVAGPLLDTKVVTDRLGYSSLAGIAQSLPVSITFTGCKAVGDACRTAHVRLKLSRHIAPGVLNRWNLDQHFGRAFADPDDRAVIEMPLLLEGGLQRKNLINLLGRWEEEVSAFKQL